jgi:two-component system, chemotaxis family, chemotaxis protein CheY
VDAVWRTAALTRFAIGDKDMRVLVVEDDFISRRLLCRYLEPHGECDVAVNGNEALSAFRQALLTGQYYDLICLDIMMPGMDGQETLKRIRILEREANVDAARGVKVIMTSALEDQENVLAAYNNSCAGYVVKPIEKRKFLETLQDIGIALNTTGLGSR